MPRFFFNVRAGGVGVKDPEGTEAPNLEAVRAMALATVRQMLAANIKADAASPVEAIVVTDEDGNELVTVLAKDILPKALR